MSGNENSGGSPAVGADQQSDALDRLLWSGSTEEEYLKQIVGRDDIDCDESEEDQAETSTLPGAIKAMDKIHVDEDASLDASLDNRYIHTLERILRFVKKKEVHESDSENKTSRDQNELVESHDNDDNFTVDEMIEESEREEETNLNNILERIPANTGAMLTSSSSAATSTKTIRMNVGKTVEKREAASPPSSSNKKSLTKTMNNSFSSKKNIRDGNDSLAGNETIGKIVTRMLESGNSTDRGEEERTLRSWTDFQPIAGSVATPTGKNGINEYHSSDGNKFVHDDTSVGSISEEIEVIVAKHKEQFDDEASANKTKGDERTGKDTMISSLSFDGTYQARTRTAMGAMPPTDENTATDPPSSKVEGEDSDEDVEKGESEPWWLKAERLPTIQTKSSDETPSPRSSIGKAKEAPDTPSTIRIIGLATPTNSEIDEDEFDDDRNASKSGANSHPKWGRLAFLKRASIKYGSFYTRLILTASAMLVLSIILVIAVSAKLNRLAEEANEPPPTDPKTPDQNNIFHTETTPSDLDPTLDWSYIDDNVGSGETDLPTDSPSPSVKHELPQTGSDLIEAGNMTDFDPQEDLFDSIQPDLENFSHLVPNATLNMDNPDFAFYYRRLERVISLRLPESKPLFKDPTSPQYRALEWLSTNPPSIEELKFRPLMQKYMLAVLYYSTGGDQWLDNTGWMSTEDECEWFASSNTGSLCDLTGRVIEIDLRGNNLVGTLPSELVLLSESITRIRVNGNSLEGTVPSFLGEMTELERFHVHWNLITGTIPTDVGELSSSMLSLRLGHNEIVGTIPWQLRNLENLEALDLASNDLTGTVPFFLGDLSSLCKFMLYAAVFRESSDSLSRTRIKILSGRS